MGSGSASELEARLRRLVAAGGVRRPALVCSVAFGALSLGGLGGAIAGPGPCSSVANTVTCTGDQSAGAFFGGPPDDTLKVNSLTSDITPAAGTPGVRFGSTGNITIESDTGGFRIITTGANARGVTAQTGGGSVTVTSTGAISTAGADSDGIYAVSFANAPVTVTSTGAIATTGADASGIFAGSYSGGGTTVSSKGNITTSGANSDGISAEASSGATTVVSTGNISTTGASSDGISASASSATTVTSTGNITTKGATATGISASATGGAVRVTSTGDITTTGATAVGISARSTSAGASVVSSGNITTTGTDASGLSVQSSNAAANVTSTGNVTATGAGAFGIRGSTSGTGNIGIVVNGGTVSGGSGTGAGVSFAGGGGNTLTNAGTITSALGLSGNAILGTTGNETVTNSGTVTGLVDLGGGTNAFNNSAGGIFNTGATVELGAGSTLSNAGTLSPGGAGGVQTTVLTGKLVQTGSGRFAVDLNMATGAADRINVSGTATLAGTVVVTLSNPQASTQQVTIVSAAGGTTNAGLTVSAPFDSPAFVAELLYPNATDVALRTTIDFAPSGLNRNEAALGGHLNAVLNAGSGGLGPVINGLLSTPGLAGYKVALGQLSPEVYLKSQVSSLYASLNFANNLMSCKVGSGANAFINEGQCVWAQAGARTLRREDTGSTTGFKDDSEQLAAGVQLRLTPNLHLGFAAGYEQSAITTGTGAGSSGDRAQGGAALKYTSGAMLLAASISAGRGWYDTTRPMAIGGFNAQATSSNDASYLAGKLRAAYLFGTGDWYLKPMVDFNATRLSLGDVVETGAGGANLVVGRADKTVLSASPALEIGAQWALSPSMLLRPYVRGGATFFNGADFGATATFAGTPAGGAGFTTTTSIDRMVADVSAGADLFVSGNTVLKFNYDGMFGETTRQHSVGARASFRF